MRRFGAVGLQHFSIRYRSAESQSVTVTVVAVGVVRKATDSSTKLVRVFFQGVFGLIGATSPGNTDQK
jgi:hypothetical protein